MTDEAQSQVARTIALRGGPLDRSSYEVVSGFDPPNMIIVHDPEDSSSVLCYRVDAEGSAAWFVSKAPAPMAPAKLETGFPVELADGWTYEPLWWKPAGKPKVYHWCIRAPNVSAREAPGAVLYMSELEHATEAARDTEARNTLAACGHDPSCVGPVRPTCEGCDQEIDPDTCWCGIAKTGHSREEHYFTPMGCDCGRKRVVSHA